MIKKYTEDLILTFTNYSQLSYIDDNKKYIDIYVDDELKGKTMVYTDKGNSNREYFIANCEVIYLDSITKRN